MKKTYLLALFLNLSFQSLAQQENALHFDNFNDYVSAPSASSLIAGSGGLSITMWVLPQNTSPAYPDYDGFAGFRNNIDADFYLLQLSPNGIEARFRNSSGINYDVTYGGLLLNTAQHFTFTYDGSILTLYHNGVAVSTAFASGSITSLSSPFYIGMLPWTGSDFYLNGRMDEVSLWNKALTPSEISCIYSSAINPAEPGLVLYYNINQGVAGGNNTSISTLIDSKGNINGQLNGFALSGNTSNFVNGVTTPLTYTHFDSLCPGGTIVFGNQTITSPGTYVIPVQGAGVCDTLVTLIVTQSSVSIDLNVLQQGPVLTSQQQGATYQWIDCLNGNTPITGETNQAFTATVNGQYAVVVSLNGCTDTSACFNVTGVGINEIENNFISIWPEPFDETLTVFNHHNEPHKIIVMDIAGKMSYTVTLFPNSRTDIETSRWVQGTYFITSENQMYRKKVVKISMR